MNLIKTDIRLSIEASALNDLMMIHLKGPDLNAGMHNLWPANVVNKIK